MEIQHPANPNRSRLDTLKPGDAFLMYPDEYYAVVRMPETQPYTGKHSVPVVNLKTGQVSLLWDHNLVIPLKCKVVVEDPCPF